MECALRGLTSASATREAYVDGTLVAQVAHVDPLDGGRFSVALGEPYSEDRRFQGVLYFDDARVADRLQAQRLEVDGGLDPLQAGTCAAVSLALRAGDGTPAGLPSATEVVLAVAGGEAFADAQCQTPLTRFVLASDHTIGQFFLRPAGGSVTVSARHDDLVGSAWVGRAVEVDAGPVPAGPETPLHRDLQVSCGCSEGGATSAWALVALGVLRRFRATGRLRDGGGPLKRSECTSC